MQPNRPTLIPWRIAKKRENLRISSSSRYLRWSPVMTSRHSSRLLMNSQTTYERWVTISRITRAKKFSITKPRTKKQKLWAALSKPSSNRSQMWSGMMLQAWKKQKMPSKRRSLCHSDSLKYLPAQENPGKEFCFMDHQELVKHLLPKPVRLKWRVVLSLVLAAAILWANLLEKAKKLSDLYSRWQENNNRV